MKGRTDGKPDLGFGQPILCELVRQSTVYITHEQEEAMTLADRIAVFRESGKLEANPPVFHLDGWRTPQRNYFNKFMRKSV